MKIPDVSLDETSVSFFMRENQTKIFCNYLPHERNILILAYDFAPLNTIGAQRPYSWYLYFKLSGLHPTVVTRHWDEKVSLNENYFRKTKSTDIQPLETQNGTIIKVPYSPNLRDIIIYKYGVDRFISLRKFLTLVNNLLQFWTVIFDNKSGIYKAAKNLLKKKHFDLIIATGEPFILFRYAYKLNKKFNIPWIADYRDGWTTNYNALYNIDNFSKFLINTYFKRFEKRYVKSSFLITTTADPIKDDLRKLFPEKRIEVIYNGYFEELYEGLDRIGQNSNYLEIAYCGTIYPFQKLEMFLEGLALFIKNRPGSKIKISFYGIDSKTLESNRIISTDPEISNYIKIYDTLPQNELLMKLKKANVLLLLGNKNYPQINAKIFEYIASNRKIMLVENDHREMARIINETNSGLWCENGKDVEKHLIDFYREFLNSGSIVNEAKNYSMYTRKAQAQSLAGIILNH